MCIRDSVRTAPVIIMANDVSIIELDGSINSGNLFLPDTQICLLYTSLLKKHSFDIDGETYIPSSVIEEYNKENQTDFKEEDVDFPATYIS